MLTHHTPRKKNERKSQRGQKTQNSKFSLIVILRKNESAKNFAVKFWPPKAKKEEKKNSLVILFFWSFLSFPHFFHHPSLCFLSFFLSLRPRNQNSFFFSRAKTERERLREIERGVWKSVLRFVLFIRVYKGKKTLEIFL